MSNTGTSAAPTHSEYTSSRCVGTPIWWTIRTMAAGPSSFIRKAETLLELWARPQRRVTVWPIISSLSVLRGVHTLPSGSRNVCGSRTTRSQGVMPSCIASV